MVDETILLDACNLLNLYGTGEIEAILRSLPYRRVVGVRGRREAQSVRKEEAEERERVDLEPLIEAGLLHEEALGCPEEQDLFVEFGLLLDDGEAEALALAVTRGYAFASDDRKARRIAVERLPGTKLWSTLELLNEWQARGGIAETALGEVLRRMSYRSSYRPRATDPLWNWWVAMVEDPSS